jgi:hypothetical protein
MIRNYDCPLTMLEHHHVGLSAIKRDMARARRIQERHIDAMLNALQQQERAVRLVDRVAIGFLMLIGSLALLGWLMKG